MTLSTFPLSLTGEDWEREAPEPSYRGDGTTPDSAGMGEMGNQHQSMSQQAAKWDHTDSWTGDKKQRLQGQDTEIPSTSSDWGF